MSNKMQEYEKEIVQVALIGILVGLVLAVGAFMWLTSLGHELEQESRQNEAPWLVDESYTDWTKLSGSSEQSGTFTANLAPVAKNLNQSTSLVLSKSGVCDNVKTWTVPCKPLIDPYYGVDGVRQDNGSTTTIPNF